MSRGRVLICDDEYLIRLWLQEHLTDEGYEAEAVENGSGLLEEIECRPPDLLLLDLRLPDGSGLDFLKEVKELDPDLPVIMMTAYGEVETAVEAVRSGAHHFLEKPVEFAELLLLIEQGLEARELRGDLERYRDEHRWHFSEVTLVGRSLAMKKIVDVITRLGVRGNPANVLIRGESGTGKEVIARAIHARGPRQAFPFLTVNCTALPETLVESELFGHAKGAFTDARQEKRGLFEVADKGTVLLDEIGDMPIAAQAKLLQFLETHTLRRVGGVRDQQLDVHVLAATNRDLEAAVAAGDFREDLFYRLNVIPIEVPPLRERPEDIAPLAFHFIDELSREIRVEPRALEPQALRALQTYGWPGNARQLRNVLERVLLLEDQDTISLDQLPPEVQGGPARDGDAPLTLPASGVDLEQVERELIAQAMERAGGNKTAAARLLGVSRDTLRYRVEKYGLEQSNVGSGPP